LGKRINKNELDKDGPEYHPIETDLPEAHNKSVIHALYNDDKLDQTGAVVRLGQSCSDALKVLTAKRVIIGQIRDNEIDKIMEIAPDIDEGAAMSAMLSFLEKKDGTNYDADIADAAKRCVSKAVKGNVLAEKGKSPAHWLTHYTSFGPEYKAAIGKNFAIYSLSNVANNVSLDTVLDRDILSEAKVLAESKGFDSIGGWSLGRFLFLVAAPALASDSEVDMELAIKVVCKGFVSLLNSDFNEAWRKYGDQILLPDDDGKIESSENAPDYFSEEDGGLARKTGIVLNILVIFQCQIIASLHKDDSNVTETDGEKLAVAILRCPTSDVVAKTKLLKQGDLFFNSSKVKEARRFVEMHLGYLLQKSKDRTGLYMKYCLFLDLRKDIEAQIKLLLRVLHRSHLTEAVLALLDQTSDQAA